MIKQEYVERINGIIIKGEEAIAKLNKKSAKFGEKKNEIIKSVRGEILTTKRLYLAEELRRLRELKSVEEQTKGLKELIDDLFITSTLGTENLPTHFMDLYFTKDMITTEINHEVYRNYDTPIFKSLEEACVGLISPKNRQDKQIDYLTAKIISCVRLQDELAHQEKYYNENQEIQFSVNATPIEFDENSRIIYGDMLKLLVDGKVLNKDKDLVKQATTFEEMQIATHNSLTEATIYASHGTEFTFNDEGLCVGLKLNGRTATKEDIIAESEKIEQIIKQDQSKNLNNNL